MFVYLKKQAELLHYLFIYFAVEAEGLLGSAREECEQHGGGSTRKSEGTRE